MYVYTPMRIMFICTHMYIHILYVYICIHMFMYILKYRFILRLMFVPEPMVSTFAFTCVVTCSCHLNVPGTFAVACFELLGPSLGPSGPIQLYFKLCVYTCTYTSTSYCTYTSTDTLYFYLYLDLFLDLYLYLGLCLHL